MQSPTLMKTALVGTTAGFDPPAVNFSSLALKHMFFDGLYYLAIFPPIEFVEELRSMEVMPVLITLY